jgi:OFA family oxalate/formate antiporter-like MFS transporter
LWFLAAIVGIGFASLALVFIRDNPASLGLAADGGSIEESETRIESPSKTMPEARKDSVFWIYTVTSSMYALFGTALTFHIVSIFAEAGRGREEAFGYFFPSVGFATATSLFASWLVDRHRLKPFLIVMLATFIAGGFGLLNLAEPWGFWLLAAGFGSGAGLGLDAFGSYESGIMKCLMLLVLLLVIAIAMPKNEVR